VRCIRMQVTRAVVLAGGGSDGPGWPSVPPGPKPLVHVGNRPILFHSLEGLRRTGVDEVLVAVDPETGPAIRAAVGDGSIWGLDVRFADCTAASGLPGTLPALHDFAGEHSVLVQHADSLLGDDVGSHVARFGADALDALALRLDGSTRSALDDPLDGAWLFSAWARTILAESDAAGHDPVAAVRARGAQIDVRYVEGCRPCQGSQDTLLDANRRVLEDLRRSVVPDAVLESEVQGRVVIHPTASVERSLVRGPVIIGPGSRIVDAYVGPYTSIGADVVVEGAEVEHSILLPRAELRFTGARLETSVIGEGARVTRHFRTPNALRLSIGAGAEVALS